MPIPAIPPYPMPTPATLPEAVVGWCVDPRRAAVLVHDMQAYFLAPFDARRSPAAELIVNCRRLLDAAAAVGVPVVYSAQPGAMSTVERGLLHDFWGPGMGRGPDTDIPAELAPCLDDHVVTKWRYSAFQRTDLADHLRALQRDQLIVTGVYANTGCLATAVDAFSLDVEVFLLPDAVADFSADEHWRAVEYAAARCAAVPTTDQVLGDFRRDRVSTSPGDHAPARS